MRSGSSVCCQPSGAAAQLLQHRVLWSQLFLHTAEKWLSIFLKSYINVNQSLQVDKGQGSDWLYLVSSPPQSKISISSVTQTGSGSSGDLLQSKESEYI